MKRPTGARQFCGIHLLGVLEVSNQSPASSCVPAKCCEFCEVHGGFHNVAEETVKSSEGV